MTRTRRREVEPVNALLLFRLAHLDDDRPLLADDIAAVTDQLSIESVRAAVFAAAENHGGDVHLFEQAAARGRIDTAWATVAAHAYAEITDSRARKGGAADPSEGANR